MNIRTMNAVVIVRAALASPLAMAVPPEEN